MLGVMRSSPVQLVLHVAQAVGVIGIGTSILHAIASASECCHNQLLPRA